MTTRSSSVVREVYRVTFNYGNEANFLTAIDYQHEATPKLKFNSKNVCGLCCLCIASARPFGICRLIVLKINLFGTSERSK